MDLRGLLNPTEESFFRLINIIQGLEPPVLNVQNFCEDHSKGYLVGLTDYLNIYDHYIYITKGIHYIG